MTDVDKELCLMQNVWDIHYGETEYDGLWLRDISISFHPTANV